MQKNNLDIPFILAGSFCSMACPMLLTPIITGFTGSLGGSSLLMGLVGGLTNFCALFCRPVIGNLADRVSKYRLAMFGALFSLTACILCILAKNPAAVVAARLIQGGGFACCSVSMSTWLSDVLPREKLGSGMGLYGAMNALAMGIAPAIGIQVYQHWGYRASFSIAAFFATMLFVFSNLVQNKGISRLCKLEPASPGRKKIQLIDKNAAPIALIMMLFALPYCATQAFLVNYTNARHLMISVSMFFPFYAAVLLILRMTLRRFFDSVCFRTFLWCCAASEVAALILLAVMKSNPLMAISAAFMSGGYGLMSSVCQSKALLLAEDHHRGLANSTYYIGLDLGMTLGPVLGGALYGGVPLSLFYPLLILCVPAALFVYYVSQKFHRWS